MKITKLKYKILFVIVILLLGVSYLLSLSNQSYKLMVIVASIFTIIFGILNLVVFMRDDSLQDTPSIIKVKGKTVLLFNIENIAITIFIFSYYISLYLKDNATLEDSLFFFIIIFFGFYFFKNKS